MWTMISFKILPQKNTSIISFHSRSNKDFWGVHLSSISSGLYIMVDLIEKKWMHRTTSCSCVVPFILPHPPIINLWELNWHQCPKRGINRQAKKPIPWRGWPMLHWRQKRGTCWEMKLTASTVFPRDLKAREQQQSWKETQLFTNCLTIPPEHRLLPKYRSQAETKGRRRGKKRFHQLQTKEGDEGEKNMHGSLTLMRKPNSPSEKRNIHIRLEKGRPLYMEKDGWIDLIRKEQPAAGQRLDAGSSPSCGGKHEQRADEGDRTG